MKDVLVLQAARLGDLIQTRRLVLSLARDSRVHLAVDRGLAWLAGIICPEAQIHGLDLHAHAEAGVYSHNLEAFARLRECGFERVYNCNFSRLTGAICRLFESDRIRGYRPWHCSLGGLGRSPWARVGFAAGAMRSISPLNLVDFWAYFADQPVAPGFVNPEAGSRGPVIGIAVAGREERRSIPVDVLAEMIAIAARLRDPDRILLFGTARDQQRSRKLQKLLRPAVLSRVADLCGQTDLPGLYEAVAGLDLLITPDTGIMHLAAFCGVPVLAIFLSSAWCHETGPYGLGHTIVQAAPECCPCLECAPCSRNLACVELLRSPQFARTIGQLLAGRKPDCQAGLQVWASGFDAFGAKLELLAGADPYAERREYCRQIISEAAGVPVPQADNAAYLSLLKKFVPESEWMLPVRRYC